MRTRSTRSTLAALTVVTLVTLTGCGSSGGNSNSTGNSGSSGSSDRKLSKAELTAATLTAADLGTGFKVDTSKDDSSSSMGCLDDFDKLDKVSKPALEVDKQYLATSELEMPGVMSSVATFSSASVAEKGMTEARRILANCTSVDHKDSDGTQFKLTITTDSQKSAPDADEQINITATGTITAQGISLPMYLRLSLIRIGNNAAVAGFFTVSKDASADADKVITAAATKFVPVTQGKPAGTTAPLGLKPLDPSTVLSGGAA